MKKLLLLFLILSGFSGFTQRNGETYEAISVVLETPKDTTVFKCDIERIDDEIARSVAFYTPFHSNAALGMCKIISKGVTTYYLSVYAYDNYCSVGGTGAVVLFTDGSRLSKNVKISTNVNSGSGYTYSAFIKLTPLEVTMFTKKQVKKIKLYIFDGDVDGVERVRFVNDVKCLINSKK